MKSFHMTPEEFRRAGHDLVDWIADYRARIEEFPVLSSAKPGELREALPDDAPEHGEDFETILADVDRLILPGVTHWQSPSFFAFFPANASPPSILGDMLSTGLGVQGMLWATSPACTELETHVLDWLVDMLDLPGGFKSTSDGGGVIQDSASAGVLCAILAARERASKFETNRNGVRAPLTAYTSSQAHSSVVKAVKIAGVGEDNLRLIDVNESYAMKPSELAKRVDEDRAAGLEPFFVCATVGTTSSTAIDPVASIGEISRERGLWLHVDAAHAGTATLCPELRHLNAGLEHADSYVFDPHKWMFTSFDCSCLFVRDRKALVEALSIMPEFLRNQATDSGAVIDYRDWQVPLGRRFRALKLWFVIRHYGVEGLRHHIRRYLALTRKFVAWVEADERFELEAPVPLNLVCFRHRGGDDVNEKLMNELNASGELYLTHTKLDGRFVLRMAIGQTETEQRHVARAWQLISELAPR